MKSILFCCYGFGIGGIEKCLINLLNAIDTSKYEIDVLPMNPEYDLLGSLHADVNLLDPFDYVMNTTDTVTYLKQTKAGVSQYLNYCAFRVVNKWGKKPWKLFSAPKKEYDIAIAYAHTGYVPYYVIDCVKAKRKYMWHHEGRYVKDSHYILDKEYYPQFTNIVAVSRDDKKVLDEVFPDIHAKTIVLYNVIDKNEIRTKAMEPIQMEPYSGLKLVTVGRLSKQKGPNLLIDVAAKLKRDNVDFKWYWVGAGDLSSWMKEQVIEKHLEENVILLGNKKNPYPYVKMADIYVQPSYYEAFCTTTIEAQILEKPIVVTDVCGMREQFIPEEECIMIPIDSDAIYTSIKALINNPELKNRLSYALHCKMLKDDGILQTYYNLFDEIKRDNI